MIGNCSVVISCEHGGNYVPPKWQPLFSNGTDALDSHEGFDDGALEVAHLFAEKMSAAFYFTTISRLLVDCNRSLHHRNLFSRFSNILSKQEKIEILHSYYHPYRNEVKTAVDGALAQGGQVIHLSVHSFTPQLHGKTRNAEIGLLYDPARKKEKDFSVIWQRNIKETYPEIRVRRNYPYLGKADGFISSMRKIYSDARYMGFELELNQALFSNASPCDRHKIHEMLLKSLLPLVNTLAGL